MKKKIVFLLLTILLFLFPLNINAANAKDAKDYATANKICSGIKDEDTCITSGCIYDEFAESASKMCQAPVCGHKDLQSGAACGSYNYCKSDSVLATTYNSCSSPFRCEDAGPNSCVPFDDFGKECKIDSAKCRDSDIGGTRSVDGGRAGDNRTLCRLLYAMNDTDQLKDYLKEAMCERHTSSSTAYEQCMTSSVYTVKSAKEKLCGNPSACSDNQIPYIYRISGKEYPSCTCPLGYSIKNGKCVKDGGSGGGGCVQVESFVASYKVTNVCTGSNSCSLADCSENENGTGDADPFDKSRGHLFDTGVNNIVINGKNTGAYGGNGKAWRYNGTCNSKPTDVFCIDPGAKYHDNNAGYKCSSSMNEESDIDSGYVRIYQSALQKYLEMYKNGADLSDDQYQGIHFAFRFWTFYKNMGRFEGKDAEDFSASSILEYSNSEISKGFNGTAKWIVGNRSEQTYFMVKPNVAGYDVPNASSDPGYADSVTFFKDAVDNHRQIWKNPLKFQLDGPIDFNRGIAKIKLINIQQLRDERFLNADGSNKYNFVKGIGCREAGCSISGIDPNRDYLAAGDDSITFTVKFSGSSFTVYAKYYDKRDGKNVVLATAGNPGDYQRLLFVTSSKTLSGSISRIFEIEQTFNTNSKPPCRIIGNTFYGNDGESLNKDYQQYSIECCDSHLIDDGDHDGDGVPEHNEYCDALKNIVGVNHTDYKAACVSPYKETWAQKGCPTTCTPNNTTPQSGECDELEGDTIIISDLTDDNTLQTGNFHDSDHYCISCVGENHSTDVTGNSYLRINNNYCQVYCIEEYKFGVPGHLKTNYRGATIDYGRYLDLKVPASAKRICYTDPVHKINYAQFERDIKSLASSIKSEINTLNSLKTAYDNAKAAYDNGDAFNPTPGGICKTTEPYSGECPSGWNSVGGGTSCHHVCDGSCSCTTFPDGGKACVTSPSSGTREKECDGQPRPTSYSYSTGGYSHSSGGSCNECSVSNGSREAVLNGFKADYDNQFNKVKEMIAAYKATINSYNSCYDFNSGLCIDGNKDSNPYIEYSYEESYYMQILGSNAKLAGNWSTTASTTKFYNDVDTTNGMCSFASRTVEDKKYSNKIFTTFEVKDNAITITDNDFAVQNNNYTYKTETKSAELKPITTWYTKIGDGHATTKQEPNTVVLGNVLPISRICLDGAEKFKYTLSFKQVGQEINSCTTGRLNKIIGITDADPSSNSAKAKYVCDYTVNDKGCEGCENTYYFRSISLTDVFPKSGQAIAELAARNSLYYADVSVKNEKLANERSVPSNWASAKGKKTQELIEKNGEKTYTKEHLEYSYTLTPAGMKQIRAYNEDKTYGDFNMVCGGDWYCSSNFLDQIEQNKYSGVKQNKRSPNYEKYNGTEVWR